MLLRNSTLTSQTEEVLSQALETLESPRIADRPAVRQSTIKRFASLLKLFETKATPQLKAAIRKLAEDVTEESTFDQLGIMVIQ